MPDAVVYTDANGVIRYWNEGAVRIFGFSRSEAQGQTLDLIIPENLRERHWDGFNRTMATGRSRYGAGDVLAVPALRRDGTRISVEFTIVMFRDEQGVVTGIAAVLRDVSKQFAQMRELRKQVAQLMAQGRADA
ncbi:MAG: PAS sensor domain-containing protein [Sulfobacillus acidophilus]|uniref:PAS sensor domain-containing protein n=1 Tax=Sulfobacillus acidophilus TaxID=53633 RepID=A0A2T2WJI8_9FIRM|nr:MAG: PAS sensor domain-containing protein [Sulfobacillus acidophilus]